MRVLKSDPLRLILTTEDPDKTLRELTAYPHETLGDAYYVRLQEDIVAGGRLIPGNIEDFLRQHTGLYDVPSPSEEDVAEVADALAKEIQGGASLFAFHLGDYSYYETFEDASEPGRPEYEEFVERPELNGIPWPTVEEVCQDKDVDKSTVTRSIYDGELTCGVVTGERKRYVKPDASYRDWSPVRKKSYLRDRRLLLAKEALYYHAFRDVDELFRYVIELEERRFGSANLPETPQEMSAFFDDVLAEAPSAPKTSTDWRVFIDPLLRHFNVAEEKKLKRAFPEA